MRSRSSVIGLCVWNGIYNVDMLRDFILFFIHYIIYLNTNKLGIVGLIYCAIILFSQIIQTELKIYM